MALLRDKTHLIAAAVLGATMSIATASVTRAADAVPVLLCPFGCGPMAGDTILMNQMVKHNEPVMLLPQETPGYMYNIREMAQDKSKWKTTLFSTEDTLIQLAYFGGTPEMKQFLPAPVKVPWKLLYGEAWWGQGKFFATFDCGLKSIADLKGKRISLGLRGQSDWGVFATLFLNTAFGINGKNSDIRYLTPSQLTQQLIDGATDAAVTPIGAEPHLKDFIIPGPVRQLEATGKKVCYLGVSKADVAKVNKKYDATFVYVKLPAHTLPDQNKPLGVAFDRGFKAASASFPEKKAYEVVKAVAHLGPIMKKLNPLWKIWSPELMVCGLSEQNAHPGAIKAYKELGWWEKRKACPPMTYPQ